jgi:hypothetical protein
MLWQFGRALRRVPNDTHFGNGRWVATVTSISSVDAITELLMMSSSGTQTNSSHPYRHTKSPPDSNPRGDGMALFVGIANRSAGWPASHEVTDRTGYGFLTFSR